LRPDVSPPSPRWARARGREAEVSGEQRDEAERLAEWLTGASAAFAATGDEDMEVGLHRAAKLVRLLGSHLCGAGFVCRGGPNCTSDHK